MSRVLQDRFPRETEMLQKLFGSAITGTTLDRLSEINQRTELLWQRYVELIPARTVKYLLIAEAPPWSDSGQPQYVLDPDSRPRTLMRALCQAFFGKPLYRELGLNPVLERLAEHGFLIVDTIPFAMPYTGKRSCRTYEELVEATCASYFRDRLDNTALDWSDDVRIAFAFKANARTVINSLNGRLVLGTVTHRLTESMIAVSAAGYADESRLKQIFGLSEIERRPETTQPVEVSE